MGNGTIEPQGFELDVEQDLTLHINRWNSALPAVGTVVIVHGLGEHAKRYESIATRLSRAGFNVLTYDQRGHGPHAGSLGD